MRCFLLLEIYGELLESCSTDDDRAIEFFSKAFYSWEHSGCVFRKVECQRRASAWSVSGRSMWENADEYGRSHGETRV
jgi:hypothetical protein